jgi:D-alanine-D-alanine ligase
MANHFGSESIMKHIILIYNAVPDRSVFGADLKSEMGILEVGAGIHAALSEKHRVNSIPFTGDIVLLMEQIQDIRPDAIFNLFEGTYRFSKSEIFVPIALEMLGVPYTGSPPKTLETCVQKPLTKELLLRRSVPTPRFEVFMQESTMETTMAFPLIVKPAHEDASIGISNDSVVKNHEDFMRQVKFIHATHKQPALAEEFIDGREFNVAILGDSMYENELGHPLAPRVLPISEISFAGMPDGYQRIVSYKAKWDEHSVEYRETVPVCPAPLDMKLEMELKQIALRAFNALGCRDYARVDFRVSRDGKPFVVDINPNPDISKDAGFARAARVAGLDYPKLIQLVADFALNRKK